MEEGNVLQVRKERKKMPVKSVYTHIMRAKLYGVLTMNAIEGIVHEVDSILPPDILDDTIDIFSSRFRRYQNGAIMPTSYGDHLDRAAKSLAKDVGISVSIELLNTQAIKKVISSIILAVEESEKAEMVEWLSHPNEIILKSDRYESLINDACLYYYKESVNNINDDTLSFVRRSANELLRNKASKEALRKKLSQLPLSRALEMNPDDPRNPIPMGDMMNNRSAFVGDIHGLDGAQVPYIVTQVPQTIIN